MIDSPVLHEIEKKTDDSLSLNEIYQSIIEDYDIDFQFQESDLKVLPPKGSFIVVANHPLKGIDGILLLQTISKVRPDVKLSDDLIFPKYSALRKFLIFQNRSQGISILKRKSNLNLKEGNPLAIFPAGDFQPFQIPFYNGSDPAWNPEIIKFIKSAKVPVVPAFFQVQSSLIKAFINSNYWLLPGLVKNEIPVKSRKIILRLGSPISVEDQQQFSSADKFNRYLRSKVYCLSSPLEIPRINWTKFKRPEKVEPIAEPVNRELLFQEVDQLKKEYLLFDNNNWSVVCSPSNRMPLMMHELGRMRETTFRIVGEGTNLSLDTDEYDLYYHQLFIWDNLKQQLVGAYRIGKGYEIMQQYGIKGFYIQSLFRISPKVKETLNQSLELGRSFITVDYQKHPMGLFMLWKGILYFILKNPELRYLIGPVSISNQYSKGSKTLIIKFVMENFYHKELSKYFKPRNAFKPKAKYDLDILLENTQSNIQKLDALISDIEPDNFKVPVLLKKYLKLNAKIIAFNIDPLFNDALDGLIFLDLMEVPYQTLQALSKEINDETVLQRFSHLQ